MFLPKLGHVTRCITRDRLTFVSFLAVVSSYVVVVCVRPTLGPEVALSRLSRPKSP